MMLIVYLKRYIDVDNVIFSIKSRAKTIIASPLFVIKPLGRWDGVGSRVPRPLNPLLNETLKRNKLIVLSVGSVSMKDL